MNTGKFLSEREMLEEILKELKTLNEKLLEKNKPSPDLLDSADVQRLLKVTDSTLRRWRREGRVKFVKIGGKVYYRKEDL